MIRKSCSFMLSFDMSSMNLKIKHFILTSAIGILIVYWIYWSSNLEFTNTLIFVNTHNSFIKNTSIVPANTTCGSHPFLVIIVTSYVGHIELRSAHRRSMTIELLKSMNICRIFLLAQIPSHEKYITQSEIQDESNIFGDILQGSFIENYRNLTYKHLMGLSWASTNYKNATYILKVDDDTVFSIERTFRLLKYANYNLKNAMLGYMLNNTTPKRTKQNKWYVTLSEYPRSIYPTYLSGWYYITSPETARRITDEAIHHPKFWIDDILITGLLAEALNVTLIQLPENYWLEYYELLECCINDMLKYKISCEYVVGPNGNRNNLIYEYNEALRNCDILNCTTRTTPLKKSCILFRDRNVFSDGTVEIRHVKL